MFDMVPVLLDIVPPVPLVPVFALVPVLPDVPLVPVLPVVPVLPCVPMVPVEPAGCCCVAASLTVPSAFRLVPVVCA